MRENGRIVEKKNYGLVYREHRTHVKIYFVYASYNKKRNIPHCAVKYNTMEEQDLEMRVSVSITNNE